MRKRYVASKRHTIQVDFDDYLYAARRGAPGGSRPGSSTRLRSPRTMPTFCRHNRFIDRCPICSKTLPGNEAAASATRRPRAGAGVGKRSGESGGRRPRREGLRVRREGRAEEDGYRSELVAGLRASADAERLASEIAFSSARLGVLAVDPPGVYGRARDAAAGGDLERATWACFLIAYLCPTEDGEPFAAVDAVLAAAGLPAEAGSELDGSSTSWIWAPAARISAAPAHGRSVLMRSGSSDPAAMRRRPSRATPAGHPSAGSRGCSNGLRCPA